MTATVDPDAALELLEDAAANAEAASDANLQALAVAWSAVVYVVNDDFNRALDTCGHRRITNPSVEPGQPQ